MKPEDDSANDKYFEVAGNEVVSANLKPGVWAKALASADGNESKAKAAYIKIRVRELVAGEKGVVLQGETRDTGGGTANETRPVRGQVEAASTPDGAVVVEKTVETPTAPAQVAVPPDSGKPGDHSSRRLEYNIMAVALGICLLGFLLWILLTVTH